MALLLAPSAVTALLVLELRRAEGMRTAGRVGLVLCTSVVIAATFSLSPAETGGGGLSFGSLGYLLSGGENLGSMEKDMIVRQSLANLLMFVPADAEDFLLNSLGAGVGLLVLATARRLAALAPRERASGSSSEHARPAQRHGMLMYSACSPSEGVPS
ncbi:hypothetical protein [Streptomyces sp. NPDC055058]